MFSQLQLLVGIFNQLIKITHQILVLFLAYDLVLEFANTALYFKYFPCSINFQYDFLLMSPVLDDIRKNLMRRKI